MAGHGTARPEDANEAERLARTTFYITLIGCLAFVVAVFVFVLR